jgi:hypothetical protein
VTRFDDDSPFDPPPLEDGLSQAPAPAPAPASEARHKGVSRLRPLAVVVSGVLLLGTLAFTTVSFLGGSKSGPEPGPGGTALVVPKRVVVPQRSENGTRVDYTASAHGAQGELVEPTCYPPSGALFPPGSTIVHCSVYADGTYRTDSFEVFVRPRSQTTS